MRLPHVQRRGAGLKTIINNIRSFAQNHTAFFLLFHICVFVSSVLIFFAFGAYQNFHVMQQGVELSQKELSVFFYSEEADGSEQSYYVTKKQVEDCVVSFPDDLFGNINLFWVQYDLNTKDNYTWVVSRFRYRNGVYYPYTETLKSMLESNEVFRGAEGITVEEYNSGVPFTMAPLRLLDENDQIVLNGITYTAKTVTGIGSVTLPFPSVPDETEVKELLLRFDLPPSEHAYQQMLQCFQAAFGQQMRIQPPEPHIPGDYSYYTTIVAISVLIAVAAAANIALLYQYILEKRKRSLAILMLCGCTRQRAFCLFMAEITLLTVITFAVSVLCYQYLIMPRLFSLFPYMDTLNMADMYRRAFLVMIGSCFLITAIMCAKIVFSSSIVKIQKEGLI